MLFKRKKNNDFLSIKIEKLIDWNEPNGEGCIVSDRITKEGYKVGYMYRETPDKKNPDSGWRFLAGDEDEAYMNDSSNHHVFSINTICNYDRDIIPYIHAEIEVLIYELEVIHLKSMMVASRYSLINKSNRFQFIFYNIVVYGFLATQLY